MGKTFTYILSALATLLLGFGVGWWLGCSNHFEEVSEKVRYVERPATKIDTELFPKPTKVERIDLPKLQYHDTTFVQVPADTTAILNDYFKRRIYDLDFSTDTTGIYKLQAIVECNRLKSASATIVPLQREVENTVVKVRKFRPFVSGGVAIGDKVGVTLGLGGIIKAKHIVSAKYMRLGNSNYYGGEYGYIFGK